MQACASDVDPAGVEYDKKLLDAVLKMTGVPEGGFVEAREMFEGLVKAVNGGWDKVEPLLDADWAIFDGLKVYRGQGLLIVRGSRFGC